MRNPIAVSATPIPMKMRHTPGMAATFNNPVTGAQHRTRIDSPTASEERPNTTRKPLDATEFAGTPTEWGRARTPPSARPVSRTRLAGHEVMASRIGATTGEHSDVSDITFLIRHLGIKSAREVLDIVAQYYPSNQIPVKTQYLIEGLFDEGHI